MNTVMMMMMMMLDFIPGSHPQTTGNHTCTRTARTALFAVGDGGGIGCKPLFNWPTLSLALLTVPKSESRLFLLSDRAPSSQTLLHPANGALRMTMVFFLLSMRLHETKRRARSTHPRQMCRCECVLCYTRTSSDNNVADTTHTQSAARRTRATMHW